MPGEADTVVHRCGVAHPRCPVFTHCWCMHADLAATARATGGVLILADVRRAGRTRTDLADALRDRTLRTVCRGVYAVGPAPTQGTERLRELSVGLAKRHGDLVVLSHQSALLLHGLALFGVPLGQAAVVRTSGGVHSSGPLRVWRPRTLPETQLVDGLRVVTPAVAVAQVACAYGLRAGLVAADSALHRLSLSRDDLDRAVAALGHTRGVQTGRAVMSRVDPGGQSPGETLLRVVSQDLGLQVETQFAVRDESGRAFAYADLRVRGSCALLEFDGGIKYEGAQGRQALVAEKNREDGIRRQGWGLDRVVWPDLDDIPALAVRIRSLVARYPL